MTKDNSYTPSCVDCGTQNCKFKDRTYPEFCLTTGWIQKIWSGHWNAMTKDKTTMLW